VIVFYISYFIKLVIVYSVLCYLYISYFHYGASKLVAEPVVHV
jgi:hypothetical protein